jgi:hypothetical protein
MKKVNRKRKLSEFARCYHSRARVLFVKNLPCVVCGLMRCDNAHIEGGGAGRKADYDKIIPLCCVPSDHPCSPGYARGHHGLFHQIGVESFVAAYPGLRLDLPALAAETEARWQEYASTLPPSRPRRGPHQEK